jgi:alpha-beta hydrolase superfamily lysophospholipase
VSRGTELAGTLFLPVASGRFPALVWVHASGEHERLGYGNIVMAAIGADMALFSYDKRGVGQSQGACCPADEADAGVDEFTEQADDALAALQAVRATADGSIPVPESLAVLDTLKAHGRDFTYVVFPGAGHGLLDVDPPPPKQVIPTIIDWVRHTVGR